MWIYKPSTNFDNTKAHKNNVLEKQENNPFALFSESNCKTKLMPTNPQIILGKVSNFLTDLKMFPKKIFPMKEKKIIIHVSFIAFFKKEKTEQKIYKSLRSKIITTEKETILTTYNQNYNRQLKRTN